MKELKFNIKYILQKKEFYIAILASLLINLFQVCLCVCKFNEYPSHLIPTSEYQFILYNVNVALNSIIILVFPILFSMIFSDSTFLENQRKTTNLLHTRLNLKKNIIIRTILSFVISFIVCFICFMYNYLLLRIIYGTGNLITPFQDTAFLLHKSELFFLDNIRIANPKLFIILISASVSTIIGFLSMLSYLISTFFKQKIVIYFFPLIFLIMWETFISFLEKPTLSFITMLQPFSYYSIFNYIVACLILLFINIVLLTIKLCEKDVLL